MTARAAQPAVVLFSGGLDSTTVLAQALSEDYAAHALSFRYGQRHDWELCCASNLASAMRAASHRIVEIDLRAFGSSALTSEIPVPKGRAPNEISRGIPVTYVPARNTIFLSFALAWAETLGSNDIFLGVNALDYSGYPDCRPEYIEAFQRLANLATKAGVEGKQNLTIHTPLLHLTKAEIIRRGLALGVDYSQTSSCYDPSAYGLACGECDACVLRKKGFAAAGLADPTRYRAAPQAATQR
ncbi:MAG: 7-cyano-7-deazaguanine synthase QueC [Terriglobia bacterium]